MRTSLSEHQVQSTALEI